MEQIKLILMSHSGNHMYHLCCSTSCLGIIDITIINANIDFVAVIVVVIIIGSSSSSTIILMIIMIISSISVII